MEMIGNKNKNKSWMIKILALAIIVFFNGTVFGGVAMANPTTCKNTYDGAVKQCEKDANNQAIEKCGAYEPGTPTRQACEEDNRIEKTKTTCLETAKSTYNDCLTASANCGNGIPEPGEECDDGEGKGDDVDKYLDATKPDKEKQLDSCFECKYVDVPYEFNVTKYLKIPEGQTYLEKSTNTDTSVSLKKGVIYFIVTGIEFATKIISAFALLFIIVGGIVLMVSSGNSSLQQKGKRLILYSILGLVIAFMSLIIVTSVQSIFYTT